MMPVKAAEDTAAAVKLASPPAPLPLQFSWSEVLQCPPTPESRNFPTWQYDPQLPQPFPPPPISGLKDQRKPLWSV